MGQQLSNVNSTIIDWMDQNGATHNFDSLLSSDNHENINLFLSGKTLADETVNGNHILISEELLTKNIQNDLSILTKGNDLIEINTKVDKLLLENGFTLVANLYRQACQDMKTIFDKQCKLRTAAEKKLSDDNNPCESIFSESSSMEDNTQQFSYFAIQMLTSLLLVSVRIHEKIDASISSQIIIVASQLCEQIPIKALRSHENSLNSSDSLMFKSLIPLINYIKELSLLTDGFVATQAVKILLKLSIAQGSFQDLLSIISRMIFNTTDVYNLQHLLRQMNDCLIESSKECEPLRQDNTKPVLTELEGVILPFTSLSYLKSIGAYPNTELTKLPAEQFNGQFISAIILSHIDIHNEINSSKQFNDGSISSSISFEFHPHTFKQLFDLLEKLTTTMTQSSNPMYTHLLTVCIRLFRTHLQFLSASISRASHASLLNIDLTIFASDTDLQKWIDLLLTLACNDQSSSESISIRQEASKALVYAIDIKSSSFTEKLSFIHQYIIENKTDLLINQLFLELNNKETLLDWIETLCENKSEQDPTLTILYSLVDIYLDERNHFNAEQRKQIGQILESFQQFFLVRLVPQSRLKRFENNTKENHEIDAEETLMNINSASNFARYISHVLQIYLNKRGTINIEFLDQILIGLSLMTQTEIFSSDIVHPIFFAVLPLLASYLLQCPNHADNKMYFLYWLIGRMTYVLVIGCEENLFEIKHKNKLKSFLFSGGCERTVIEHSTYLLNLLQSELALHTDNQQGNPNEADQTFLMSVYHNIDQGAQLISKIKNHVRSRRQILKSIEQQTSNACAAVFAVYLKHYGRINLARSELSHADNQRVHNQLLSLYEYASNVEILFVTTKAQGGDCDQLYKQIQMKSLFLLTTVAKSNFIPIIEEDLSQSITTTNLTEVNNRPAVVFQRQRSQWTKAKHIFAILRHTLHACIRLKKLMLARRQAIEQNEDNESILHQEIHQFICGHVNRENEDMQVEFKELTQCLTRQYERGMTRLLTYRFIQKMFQIEDKTRALTILNIYSPYWRKSNISWTYLEHIPAVNNELKDEIRKHYYSIIKIVLSLIEQSKYLERHLFYLLNISYHSTDISLLSQHRFIETLFRTNVSFIAEEHRIDSLRMKLIGFNWFRFYVLKLCQISGRQEQDLIFNTLILNELKGLREMIHTDDKRVSTHSIESIHNCSIGWFVHVTTDQTSFSSSKFQIELCINQWLTLLLRCVHLSEHIRSICGTRDFIEEILLIYRTSNNRITILLALKILRDVFPSFGKNNSTEIMMHNLFKEFLFTIGESYTSQSISSEIVTELIYIYRMIMSRQSPWQSMVVDLVFNSVTTMDWNDKKQWNCLLASLCILGGYIEPYGLGSIVKVHTEKSNDPYRLGMIVEIDRNACDQGTIFYLVQYLDNNQTEQLTIDRLEIQVDISPANLLTLPNANESNQAIHSLLDTLGYILQIDQTNENDLHLLQLKRCSMGVLNQILTDKKIIEIFLQKSYASLIGQLAMIDASKEYGHQLSDLRLFNRIHLEQYSLSLDEYIRLSTDHSNVTSVSSEQKCDTRLSNNTPKYNGWKAYASRAEIDLYKKGRNGREKLSLVPYPRDVADLGVIQQCGDKHRYHGRICLDHHHNHERFPSFIFENLTLSEGNWYYCVKLPIGGLVQIGWATSGFTPRSSAGSGIGDDRYSWSFDGSRGTLYHDREFQFLSDEIRWKADDVCGCGIEINGENIQIKYWLNGQFLGTAFTHQANIASTTIKCNLLPHGPTTKFFPGITVQSSWFDSGLCEIIVSPEDMSQCPLPDGYKPLLMPKLIPHTGFIVAYPYSAYLVGDNVEDFTYTPRNAPSSKYLRDFINDQHIETTAVSISEYEIRLMEDSDGWPFSLDNSTSAFTISFEFYSPNKSDILLFTLDTLEYDSARISLDNNRNPIKTVLIIDPSTRQIQIYLNTNQKIFRTIHIPSDHPTNTKFHLHLLPKLSVGIQDIAFWKYALSPEHIGRLFLNGLWHIASDYDRQKEYRLTANTFTFRKNQTYFSNEVLIPMEENFSVDKWKLKQKQIDTDESKYFHTIDEGTILQFYGNQTYIVIEKSAEQWLTYTIILDILLPNLPIEGERLSLVLLNLQANIFITSTGQICLMTANSSEDSEGKIQVNQWIRMLITVEKACLQIYVDGSRLFNVHAENDALHLLGYRLHLFRELDLSYNTTKEDILRIQCKSITFLNRSIQLEKIFRIPPYSFELLIAPPFASHVSSLVHIGYKIEWIKSVMRQYQTTNLQFIDTIIREQQDKSSEIDIPRRDQCHLNTLLRLGSAIDRERLTILININDPLRINCELLLNLWNDLQTVESHDERSSVDEDEFYSTFKRWIHQQCTVTIPDSQSDEKQTLTKTGILLAGNNVQTSVYYSHKNISFDQYRQSRIGVENGLISFIARDLIFNIMRIWSSMSSDRFPLNRLTDYSSIVKFLQSIYISTDFNFDDRIHPVLLVIQSIIKHEINELSEETPLLFHLQKEMIIQSMEMFFQIFLSIDEFENNMSVIEEQVKAQGRHFDFILTILHLFMELTNDHPSIFSEPLLNILFDLFLILPSFQSKIFVLHLFLSEGFHPNQRIENSILKFSMELLSNGNTKNNRMMKTFQTLLMDLIYRHFLKNPSEFPQMFQDLGMICDTIKAMTHQSPFPEMLIIHALNIFDESILLTLDDLAISNVYFDQKADLQLVNLMNNDVLIDHSFSEFIFSLENVYQSSATYSDLYPSLGVIPIGCVQTRVKLFHLLETWVERVLSSIDLTLPPGESFLIDQIRSMKSYFRSGKRMSWFEQSLKESKAPTSHTSPRIQFDLFQADNPDSSEHKTTFEQAHDQLHENAHVLFRCDDVARLWSASFIGMHGIDQGGPYRDSITSISSDICSNRLLLFILCPNGRTDSGENRDRWIPNVFPPNESIPNRIKKQYRFVGQLIGMAIRRKHYLDLKFSSLLWKQLLGEQLTIKDIESIDIQSFVLIEEMQKNLEQSQSTDNGNDSNYLFSSIMSELRFDVISSAGHCYELIPNGNHIPITAENFKEYCRCYQEYRLNEFSRQIEYMRQGLHSVVPNDFLPLLTVSELEEAVCGKSRIDIDLLKRNTRFHQADFDSTACIERFWHVLKEMFTEEQKKLFLKFVWGRNTLPSRDEDFKEKFSINLLSRDQSEADRMLPRSHTCSFALDLPPYSTTQIMYERLNYSITYCSSIDGDG